MKALTLHQPWGCAIVSGAKTVENRTWAPPIAAVGRYFAVHAGKTYEREMDTYPDGSACPPPEEVVQGAILGVVKLVAWTRVPSEVATLGPWAFGPVCWHLSDAIEFPFPVPCRGKQSLWTVPDDVEAEVREQLAICRKLEAR